MMCPIYVSAFLIACFLPVICMLRARPAFDHHAGRDMPGFFGVNTMYSLAQCQEFCKNSFYMGLQYGYECYCGNDFGRYGKVRRRSKMFRIPFDFSSVKWRIDFRLGAQKRMRWQMQG
jgi:hypothetical protein